MQAVEVTKGTRKQTNPLLDSILLKENVDALASSNAYVEAHGLPLARHRQF